MFNKEYMYICLNWYAAAAAVDRRTDDIGTMNFRGIKYLILF